MNDASQLIQGMRLGITEDQKKELVKALEDRRFFMSLFDEGDECGNPSPFGMSKSEQLKKTKQLAGALTKAKKLFNELHEDLCDLDDIPEAEIQVATSSELMFTRDNQHELIQHSEREGSALWGLQLIDHLEKWATSYIGELQESEEITRGKYAQRQLQLMAQTCNEYGIKISAAENSQFYRIASYVAPHISDIKYRIRKLLQEAKWG